MNTSMRESGLSLCPAEQLWLAGRTSPLAPPRLSLPRSVGFLQRWRAEIPALGLYGAAFPILTAVLPRPVSQSQEKASLFFLQKLGGTVAQDLGTPDASSRSHFLLWLHCEITCMFAALWIPLLRAQRRGSGKHQVFRREGFRTLRELSEVLKPSKRLSPPAPRVRWHIFISAFLVPHASDKNLSRFVNIAPYHGPRETLSDTSFWILLLGSRTVTEVSPHALTVSLNAQYTSALICNQLLMRKVRNVWLCTDLLKLSFKPYFSV